MTDIIEQTKARKPTIKFGDLFVCKSTGKIFKIIEKFKNGEFLAIDNILESGVASVEAIRLKEVGFYHREENSVSVTVDAEDNFYSCLS